MHQLFDAVAAISVQGYDEKLRVTYWNTGSELLYGYTAAEALGRTLQDLIIPQQMQNKVITAHKNWLDHGIEIPATELILRNKYGHNLSVFSSHIMYYSKQYGHEMYCIDISLADIKRAQAQVALKDNLLKSVFEATPDLFFLLEENGTIIDYHAGENKNLYSPPIHYIGRSIAEILPEKVVASVQAYSKKAMHQGGIVSFEYELSTPKGPSYFEARIRCLIENKQLVVIIRDISEQHKSKELIRKQAYFDALTSLPNRFLSLDRLSQMIKEMERLSKKGAVFFLDIDDFKKVNDSLGHEIGDKLLTEAANRLNLAVRKTDTVGRLGGDEFIVLLQSITDTYDVISTAKNLLDIFKKPYKIGDKELVLTLSIGISLYPENGDCASDLLRNADTAMYQSKAAGRNTYSFFTKEMNNIILRRLEIEAQLHGALERDELEVYYQPKIDMRSGCIVGAEALLRWHNHTLGNVPPDEFIPIAEHTGLIVNIGEYVIEKAIHFLFDWQNTQNTDYTIAINLSPRQFRGDGLVNFIKASIGTLNIRPDQLEFEITEGLLISGKSYINTALNQLHELGVKLSMDDFGTGYSSLSYLREYPFDILKIDRSFVSGITSEKKDLDLVIATIAMAHSLGLLVVAEGVETREQLNLLDDLGCDIAQGYYFSKPVPAKEMITFQRTGHSRTQ